MKVQRPGARIESRDADEAGCGEGVSPSQVREGTVEIVFFIYFESLGLLVHSGRYFFAVQLSAVHAKKTVWGIENLLPGASRGFLDYVQSV